MPRLRPAAFGGNAHREAARWQRGRKPFLPTPPKVAGHRKQAASGSPFLWILSFGDAKESIPPVGAGTDIKTTLAKRNLKNNPA